MVGPSPPVLRRLLEAAGYRLREAAGAIVATRAADHRAVVLARSGRSPSEVERLFPADAVHRTVVYDDEPGDAGRSVAAERGIEVLDPSTLGPALGELLLPSALIPGGSTLEDSDADALESPFPLVGPEARTVRPRIGRDEAQTLAGLDAARYTLRLVPFFVAAYRVRIVAPDGGPGPVHRRLIAVNATSRRAEVWEEGERELVAEVSGPAQRLAPQLNEAGAAPIAVDAIRRHHTVRVDHTEQHDGALVIESRRVPPAAEDVRLGPFALIYVPFWYAEGSEGRVVLDAVSGREGSAVETRPA